MSKKPVVLMILDGFAFGKEGVGNAALAAKTPFLDGVFSTYPTTQIHASGLEVGLPEGQMGNSEVGHTNIGAGRVVYQDLTKITKEIKEGKFFENKELLEAISHCKSHNTKLHLMGLLSDGGVHSHIEHLFGLLDLCKRESFKDVYIHAFLDGRDTPPKSGLGYLKQLQTKLDELGFGVIATVQGRFYAMDRDKRYERVQKSYDCMVAHKPEITFDNPLEYVNNSYSTDATDEFVLPARSKDAKPIEEKDGVIFFNFRPDRARELTDALTQNYFDGFQVAKLQLYFVGLTQYNEAFEGLHIAYPVQEIKETLGQIISDAGKKQLRIAETEKYAHVTFFFNAGREEPFLGEERILIPSPKVVTYDMQPQMSAPEVTNEVIKALDSDTFDLIVLNYANCDMVGHTGVFEAAVKAVETVDKCAKTVVEKVLEKQGVVLLTADHGNCEQMVAENGEPFTAHTTNLVPFTVIGQEVKLNKNGKLSDIAPTILKILEIPQPDVMTGKPIICETFIN